MEADEGFERMTDDTIGAGGEEGGGEEDEEEGGGGEESSEVPSWMDEGRIPQEIKAEQEEIRGRRRQQGAQEASEGDDDGSKEEGSGTDVTGSDVDDEDDDYEDDSRENGEENGVGRKQGENKEERIRRLKEQIAQLEGTLGKNEEGQVGKDALRGDSEVEEAERLMGMGNGAAGGSADGDDDDDDDNDRDGGDEMLEDEVRKMLSDKAEGGASSRGEMEVGDALQEENGELNLEDDSEIERLLEAEKEIAGGPERSADWLNGPLPPPPRYDDEKHKQSPIAYIRLSRSPTLQPQPSNPQNPRSSPPPRTHNTSTPQPLSPGDPSQQQP